MKKKSKDYPRTVDEAVQRIILDLSLKEKVEIARMKEKDLAELNHSIGLYIRDKFGLWFDNDELVKSCGSGLSIEKKEDFLHSPSFIIIKELWLRLRQGHQLRRVK